ncbi:hypothetical protein NBE98_17935 [Clostridium swellfunianum]|uniref:hypothetical protein n=1 Tax=Clostridium swellfunianum TaxID=1367462 RepID=UPI0020300328|nr:hypothetical protein [Clostridium swellfunianum]MCM0650249.1 hypothetical protein [Clostridium swellfunianum]
MKKVSCLLILAALLVFISGCTINASKESLVKSKYSIDQFKSLFSDFAKEHDIKEIDINIEAFHDITPENVFKETKAQIFKNGKNSQSYLLYEGKLYNLGRSFGGYGIVDIVTCDFDKDGKKELIYTYSWGSGIHRSCIGHFDLLQKREVELDISTGQPLDFIKEDLAFNKVLDTSIEVYTAVVKTENGDFTKIPLEKDKLFGTIKAIKNKPVFEKVEKKS